SSSSVEGIMPFSLSSVAFTNTITRMVVSLGSERPPFGLHAHTTNGRGRNRHGGEENFCRQDSRDKGKKASPEGGIYRTLIASRRCFLRLQTMRENVARIGVRNK